MAKGYWVVAYREISKPEQAAEYSKLAGPIIKNHGGTVLVRTTAAKAYELGKTERVVISEFESLEKAIACYESAEYAAALKVLGDAADRDFRIVEGAN